MNAWVAGPPSPGVPTTPGPATVVMLPAPNAGPAPSARTRARAAAEGRGQWRIRALSEPEATPVSSQHGAGASRLLKVHCATVAEAVERRDRADQRVRHRG